MCTKAAAMRFTQHLPASVGTHALRRARSSPGCLFQKDIRHRVLADLLLEEAKVVVAPGVGFGTHGEGYVRLGLLSSEERLAEAVQRIGKLNLI